MAEQIQIKDRDTNPDLHRVLWLSDSALGTTGFGNQTKNICKRLQNYSNWDMWHIAWNQHGQPLAPPIKLLDTSEEFNFPILTGGKQQYAIDLWDHYFTKYKPDIFGVLLDTFMLFPIYIQKQFPCKTFFYFPSDGGWFPKGCEQILKKCNLPIAMSKFGRDQLADTYGIQCEYIPHGCDAHKNFFPQDKQQAKIQFGIDPNIFVVGANFRNQGRKFTGKMVKAFAEFSKDKNDVVLLQNTDPTDPAAANDIMYLAQRFKCPHKIRFTGMTWTQGLSMEQLSVLYNAFDVNLSTTSGEGFGITTIEAMASEVPTVIPEYTTGKELVADHKAGIATKLIGQAEEGDSFPHERVDVEGVIEGSWEVDRGVVSIKDTVRALQYMYDNPAERARMGRNGRAAVLREYDWESGGIIKKWNKVLGALVR